MAMLQLQALTQRICNCPQLQAVHSAHCILVLQVHLCQFSKQVVNITSMGAADIGFCCAYNDKA